MPKPEPPVFHIPVGHTRGSDGNVVLFDSDAEQARAMEAWCTMVEQHPATVAAGYAVVVGPSVTQLLNLARNSVTVSRRDRQWEPSAISDWEYA